MIEVFVESIRVNMTNYRRVVMLKEKTSPRYLPIWIGLQTLYLSKAHGAAATGIAYWAHLGGFGAGMFLSAFVTQRQNPQDF